MCLLPLTEPGGPGGPQGLGREGLGFTSPPMVLGLGSLPRPPHTPTSRVARPSSLGGATLGPILNAPFPLLAKHGLCKHLFAAPRPPLASRGAAGSPVTQVEWCPGGEGLPPWWEGPRLGCRVLALLRLAFPPRACDDTFFQLVGSLACGPGACFPICKHGAYVSAAVSERGGGKPAAQVLRP